MRENHWTLLRRNFTKNFKWRPVFFTNESQVQSVPDSGEIGNDDVEELLDSHSQELTLDELIEMREQEQGIEEPDSLDLN